MDTITLLIIDDDKIDRLNYRNLLVDNIYFKAKILEASCAKDGIEIWQSNKIDCILLDYNLPDMNGLDCFYKLKKMGATLPVIMLTAEDNVKTIVAAMKSGVTDYITKNDITPITLIKTVQNALSHFKLEKQLLLNKELKEQRKISEEEHRIKYEFLSNMSHELRTPLTKIIGFAQLLQNEVLGTINEEQNAALLKLFVSANYLLKMINNAIEILAIDSGKFIFEPKKFFLPEVINEAINMISPKAKERQIEISTILDKSITSLYLDPQRFKEVLNNLLENALKFTADGGYIHLRVKPDTPETFCLEVEDSGIGIASKDLETLFSDFKPLDASTTKKYTGIGLGLALIKRIVECQGGHVKVSSVPDKGSIFSVTLPLKSPPSPTCVEKNETEVTLSD